MANRYPLTEEQFRQLPTSTGWPIVDIPPEQWSEFPGLVRLDDTVAVMVSGSTSDPRILNSIRAVAGIDQLVHETNPAPGEPEGNAYHFVIQEIRHDRFPYVLHGPFRSETTVPHWFGSSDLYRYWAT
jgi:hypothetical protein